CAAGLGGYLLHTEYFEFW
nr:immunoglobulin heavy chain junction region [Macaca mulatta]MOX59481.1 immunoglobulin heavy chain junction region [Macaca mulatta]MOX60333.1 immunoglobulin heavy chain junction region [Macaca mulatta]MOX62248.1 immunoglobulin heavy chain junction region [Macaca mulatta]MOX62255.1 immunoglobulin heavy chain junction region [Macaca mulatta]